MLTNRQRLKSTSQNLKSTSRPSTTSQDNPPAHNGQKHGLVVYYTDGSTVLEKNNYFSERQGKVVATNWSDIQEGRVQSLELYWHDHSAIRLNLSDIPDNKPDKWIFSHTGTVDLSKAGSRPIVVSRNIGYEKNGLTYLYRVNEESGTVTFESKKAS